MNDDILILEMPRSLLNELMEQLDQDSRFHGVRIAPLAAAVINAVKAAKVKEPEEPPTPETKATPEPPAAPKPRAHQKAKPSWTKK